MPVAVSPSDSAGAMLAAIQERGVTPADALVLRECFDLQVRMRAIEAKEAFDRAVSALKSEIPPIVAKTQIPNRGKYEKFEHLMDVIGPLAQKHEIGIAFRNEWADNRITETCLLSHRGHTEPFAYTTRIGRKADDDTQADSKAATTARRNALIRALNIVIRQDCLTEEWDAAQEGGLITQEQADSLKQRVIDTKSDLAAFLRFAGASSFAQIKTGKLAAIDAALKTKEREQ